jgi:hypothetical protein
MSAPFRRSKTRCANLTENGIGKEVQRLPFFNASAFDRERASNKPPNCKTKTAARLGEPDGGAMEIETKAGNLQRQNYAAAGQNAIIHLPVRSAARDAELLAADIVREFAFVLSREADALLSAAEDANTPQVEARLWSCRRCLSVAIKSWREAVPARFDGGGRNG